MFKQELAIDAPQPKKRTSESRPTIYLPFLPLYEYCGKFYLHHREITKQEYNELRSALNNKHH